LLRPAKPGYLAGLSQRSKKMTVKKQSFTWGLFSLLIGLILISVGCQAAAQDYEYKGFTVDPPQPIPDFTLTSSTGQPFHLSDVKGDIALVYFGYTFCPDVCPLTLAFVKQALAGMEPSDQERVHVIFISVDPERDTPEVLSRYLAAFNPTFIGLTDDFNKVKEVMKPFRAKAEREEVPGSAAGYLMSHTARLFLVDPNQNLLLTYPHGFRPEDLQSDLTYLLNN
jgi:protein SCO1/2